MWEYVDHGNALAEFSYPDFFLSTYDAPLLHSENKLSKHHLNVRIPYLETSGRTKQCRILQSKGHETMPFFPGQWFPCSNDASQYPLYCATMLALLKPWKSLATLKPADSTFKETFDRFLANATPRIHNIIENIQYFYKTSDKASERRSDENPLNEWNFATHDSTERHDDAEDLEYDHDHDEESKIGEDSTITENDIETALTCRFSTHKLLYADVALNIAAEYNFFMPVSSTVEYKFQESNVMEMDLQRLNEWTLIIDH